MNAVHQGTAEPTPKRPVVLQVSGLSLDGYICEEGSEFEALADPIVDDQRDAWMVASLWRAGVHIMGATTYRAMSDWWPNSTAVFADVMNQIPKVVFSRTMTEARWPETRISSGDTAEELTALQHQGAGEIIAHGGARFAQYLAGHDLINEYRLIVYPIVVGHGTPLFPTLPRPRELTLISETAFPSGSVAFVYRRSALTGP